MMWAGNGRNKKMYIKFQPEYLKGRDHGVCGRMEKNGLVWVSVKDYVLD
jgi:hypothetical protein